MPNETRFQIAFILSLFAFLAVRAYYRLKSERLHQTVASSRNVVLERILRTIFGILLLGLLILLMYPNWTKWSAIAAPGWARWGGAGLVVIALVLLVWAHHTLDTSFSPALEIRERHKLVTTGLYRSVRHPMYFAMFLWAVGLCLITANWITVLAPLGFALFFMFRVPGEEKMMVETFGDEYRAYMTRTGRFLPRLARTK